MGNGEIELSHDPEAVVEQPKEMEEEIENTKRSFVLNTWPDGDELYTLHGVNPGTIPEKGPRYIGFRRGRGGEGEGVQ